jgi:molybdenum cofactor cytidylyltransferase
MGKEHISEEVCKISNIEALVLAAGLSRRMNTNKLLLKIGDKTIIQKTIDNLLLSSISSVTVVLGNMKEEIVESLAGYKISIVENEYYAEGMGTSLLAGVRMIMERKKCDAIMFFNGDMPFIKPSTIDAIVKKHLETQAKVIFPCCYGERGHPVLVDKSLFPELLSVSGDIGAREILQKYAQQTVFLNTNDTGIYQDIDNPDDYRRIIEEQKKGI